MDDGNLVRQTFEKLITIALSYSFIDVYDLIENKFSKRKEKEKNS